MCDPATIGAVGMGLSLVGGVVGAGGSLYAGQQQAEAYQQEAAFDDRQATLERQSGAYESARVRTANDRTLGGIRQQFISGGIDATSGSAKEVLADSAREAALDEQAPLFGAQVRSGNLRYSARLARQNADSARVGSIFDAASSLLGGATKALSYTSNRTVISNPYSAYGAGGLT